MAERPNVLVILTDQERYPPPYEGAALARFRRERLPARERLRAASTELHRHYTASTACQPSRTSLFTGQYPSLHGVTQTNGLAKQAHDPAATYLDPDTVPTMGDWFRAAGYRTYYRGKWHISHADLPFNGHAGLRTNDAEGNADIDAIDAYHRADRLDPFGFSGWVGREPHGPDPADSGFVRDELFVDQVTGLFARLRADGDDDRRPWLAVASLVNPHDIVFSGLAWRAFGLPVPDDSVPAGAPPPSATEDLAGRPGCQGEFRRVWAEMLWDQPADEAHRRFYHWLHEVVDRAIDRILDALVASHFAESTIVVFSSDHGEMLGAHGGLLQKWHNAYDETTRVPFMVCGPNIPAGGRVDLPTSHVDLLPTLLGLVGLSEAEVAAAAARVAADHIDARALVGRDLSGLLRGESSSTHHVDAPVYFMTEDDISSGLRQTGVLSGERYEPVGPPSHVETVVTHVADGSGGPGPLWKLNHYYGDRPDADDGHDWELHDLTADPEERTNLAASADDTVAGVRARLQAVLDAERSAKRLRPRFAPA